ncbi:MAG: HAMP domain-containing histidine kinase [Clostridia bacterium]|nr:HAMP domain-containing histidine kinase [Clostridia bacterium]
MNKKQRNQRISLTVFFSVIIFAIQAISIALAAVLIYILARAGVIVEINSGLPAISTVILLMSAVSLLIGVTLAFSLSVIPLKPINRFITQMNRLASGDFKARLYFGKALSSYPAFEQLSQSFNKMAEDLENTEMLRSDFINNFSHEFKTPIVSIAGFAKLLKRGNLSREQQEEYISIIEEESLRLSYMATNVLNLTKIENQSILTDISTFNLSEQIRSCVLMLENKWVQKELELDLSFAEHTVSGNEELLKEVWINLLDNAIKFSPMNGAVRVSVEEAEEWVTVSIANSGSKIEPENMKKIFNKFYQEEESHTAEGNGIGLAIVKRVTDLHGGSIAVDSNENGTVFSITLPKKQL